MDKKFRRIIEELFGNDATTDFQPNDHQLYVYAEAEAKGLTVATLFPDIHRYLQSIEMQDEHYQAIRTLIRLDLDNKLESPPHTVQFDFSYLPVPAPPPTLPHWLIEKGKLLINFSEGLLDSLFNSQNTQLAFARANVKSNSVRSNQSALLFETTMGDEQNGVMAKIQAKREQDESPIVGVTIKVEIVGRKWPHLSKIPVEVALNDRKEKQITDAFGVTTFSKLPLDELPSLAIAIGPVPELEK